MLSRHHRSHARCPTDQSNQKPTSRGLTSADLVCEHHHSLRLLHRTGHDSVHAHDLPERNTMLSQLERAHVLHVLLLDIHVLRQDQRGLLQLPALHSSLSTAVISAAMDLAARLVLLLSRLAVRGRRLELQVFVADHATLSLSIVLVHHACDLLLSDHTRLSVSRSQQPDDLLREQAYHRSCATRVLAAPVLHTSQTMRSHSALVVCHARYRMAARSIHLVRRSNGRKRSGMVLHRLQWARGPVVDTVVHHGAHAAP